MFRSRTVVLGLALVLAAPPHRASASPPPCTTSPAAVFPGRPLPSGTGEISGLAASVRHPGWMWAVRDSGQSPVLHAVRFRGQGGHLVHRFPMAGAENVDWEDVAHATNRDGTGRLYIVESGQKGHSRFIYKIGEPDPRRPGPVRRHRRYRYAFPRGGHFNVEAAFFYRSRLTLVTKTAPARVYRFQERLSERRVNRPRFLGVLRGSPRVSVARVSPDGHTLVVANHNWLYGYEADGADAEVLDFLGRPPAWRRQVAQADNVEAGDFFPETCHVILAAESKNVYLTLTQSRSGFA